MFTRATFVGRLPWSRVSSLRPIYLVRYSRLSLFPKDASLTLQRSCAVSAAAAATTELYAFRVIDQSADGRQEPHVVVSVLGLCCATSREAVGVRSWTPPPTVVYHSRSEVVECWLHQKRDLTSAQKLRVFRPLPRTNRMNKICILPASLS